MSYSDKQQIIICSSNAILGLKKAGEQFACWIHSDIQNWPKLAEVVDFLAENGCSLFHLSGLDSKELHDRVDDILIGINKSEILTSWSDEGLKDAAETFWDITAASGDGYLKFICVVASDMTAEMKRVSEISAHLKAASEIV